MRNAKREARKLRTRGTAWAEKTRAQCNKLDQAEREKLLERAMQIAHGTTAETTTTRRG
jgi:hypothetical protein